MDYRCRFILAVPMHVFGENTHSGKYISNSNTECNLLSTLGDNDDKICKWSALKLNFRQNWQYDLEN